MRARAMAAAGRALLGVIVRLGRVHAHHARARRASCPTSGSSPPTATALTRTAVTAAFGAGAFGLLSALVWPLLVRALLLVPALVLGLLVFFLNGSLLLIALRPDPRRRGDGRPGDRGGGRRRDVRRRLRHLHRPRRARRRRLPAPALPARGPAAAQERGARSAGTTPGTVFLQLDGVGHDVLLDAVGRRRDADRRRLARRASPTHRLTPWRTDWSSQTGASQLGILHGTQPRRPRLPLVREGHRRDHRLQPAHQRRRTPAPRHRAHR